MCLCEVPSIMCLMYVGGGRLGVIMFSLAARWSIAGELQVSGSEGW